MRMKYMQHTDENTYNKCLKKIDETFEIDT
jgi:hypothetical protein